MNPTLLNLRDFVPQNEAEKQIYNIDNEKYIIQKYINVTKSSYSHGKYWLGGQIKLNPNDEITPELLNNTFKIFNNAYYCNSFEQESIVDSQNDLYSINSIVKKYIEIQKMRILKELEKTKLMSDVNNVIIKFI
jgi:hypothetical protein